MNKRPILGLVLATGITVAGCAIPQQNSHEGAPATSSAEPTASLEWITTPSAVPDPADGLRGYDFWQLASGIQPNVKYQPADLADLKKNSDLIVVANIVDVEPYEGADTSVIIVLQTSAEQQIRVRFSMPFQIVTDFGPDAITSTLPAERAAWFLKRADYQTPVPDMYDCTQFYYCAFVLRGDEVVSALSPKSGLPGTIGVKSLAELTGSE